MNQESDINLHELMKERFTAGEGVVTLSPSMTDDQILKLLKLACTWSQGKAFKIVPPRTN